MVFNGKWWEPSIAKSNSWKLAWFETFGVINVGVYVSGNITPLPEKDSQALPSDMPPITLPSSSVDVAISNDSDDGTDTPVSVSQLVTFCIPLFASQRKAFRDLLSKSPIVPTMTLPSPLISIAILLSKTEGLPKPSTPFNDVHLKASYILVSTFEKPTILLPSLLTSKALLKYFPPDKSPRAVIPSDAVHLKASTPLLLSETPTTIEPSELIAFAILNIFESNSEPNASKPLVSFHIKASKPNALDKSPIDKAPLSTINKVPTIIDASPLISLAIVARLYFSQVIEAFHEQDEVLL